MTQKPLAFAEGQDVLVGYGEQVRGIEARGSVVSGKIQLIEERGGIERFTEGISYPR